MTSTSTAAAAARENARASDGRFGEQDHADPGQLDLADDPSTGATHGQGMSEKSEATGNDHPGWAQPGCPVAILNGAARTPDARLVAVERVTATQVIAGGVRFRARPGGERYREIGSSRPAELRQADDPEVIHLMAQRRVELAAYEMQHLLDSVSRSTYAGLRATTLKQAEQLQPMAAQLADTVRERDRAATARFGTR